MQASRFGYDVHSEVYKSVDVAGAGRLLLFLFLKNS